MINIYASGIINDGQLDMTEEPPTFWQPPEETVVDIERETLDTRLSKTFKCGDVVLGRITPIHSDIFVLDFTSPDGIPIAVPSEIEVWDSSGPRAIRVSPPGSNNGGDSSYFCLSGERAYEVRIHSRVVKRVSFPRVPVFL